MEAAVCDNGPCEGFHSPALGHEVLQTVVLHTGIFPFCKGHERVRRKRELKCHTGSKQSSLPIYEYTNFSLENTIASSTIHLHFI